MAEARGHKSDYFRDMQQFMLDWCSEWPLALADLLKIFMGLALVHFQKYWLLRVIFDQCPKLHLGLDVPHKIPILNKSDKCLASANYFQAH